MTIFYCTSITQPWVKVKDYAQMLCTEYGGNIFPYMIKYVETPPYLNANEMKEFTETAILEAHKKGEDVVVATMEELPLLRILRRIREANEQNTSTNPWIRGEDLVVHCLLDPSKGRKIEHLRVSDDGEFIDRWSDGLFDHRMEELF